MYVVLKGLIAESGLTLDEICTKGKADGALNCERQTLSKKVNGESDLTVGEAKFLMALLAPGIPMEVVFCQDVSRLRMC